MFEVWSIVYRLNLNEIVEYINIAITGPDNYIFGPTAKFHKLQKCDLFDMGQRKTAVNGTT